MKKIVCFILVAVMAIILVGCETASASKERENNGKQTDHYVADGVHFTVVQSWIRNGDYNAIIKHEDTGVCYFYYDGYYATCMTVMLNADGTPYTGD